MNFIYLYVFLLSYLFMYVNNKYKINLYKINKYYNKVNYKLTILTSYFDFSYENIFIFSIYILLNEIIYFIFVYKLIFMIYLIYENRHKKNIIYNITDFLILSIAVFTSQFTMMYYIASVLLVYIDFKIY